MKANKIFTETQLAIAKSNSGDSTFQNCKSNYIHFGTYGCTITYFRKDGDVNTKTVNNYIDKDYIELCKEFDAIDFD